MRAVSLSRENAFTAISQKNLFKVLHINLYKVLPWGP